MAPVTIGCSWGSIGPIGAIGAYTSRPMANP